MDAKKRSENQVPLLLASIEERKTVIRGKFGPNLSIKDKKKAWAEIASIQTSAFPWIHTTPCQAEKKWQNLLSEGKRSLSARRRNYGKTGKIYFHYFDFKPCFTRIIIK